MAVLWVGASRVCSGHVPLATGRATSAAASARPLSSGCPVVGQEQGGEQELEGPTLPSQGR